PPHLTEHSAPPPGTSRCGVQTSPRPPRSSSVLVIQGQGSIMATSESRVTHLKILKNPWRNRTSSHDQLGHQLACTKTDDESTSYTLVGNCADSRGLAEY